MADMYYLEQKLYVRINGQDEAIKEIIKTDYMSDNKLDLKKSLIAGVDTVIWNTAGNYILLATSETDTATFTLHVDSQDIDFKNFMSGIFSGTAFSIESDVNADLTITLIKID